MSTHALHSPNLTQIELKTYLRTKAPARHAHSLIEKSMHDRHLLKFIDGPLTRELLQEVVLVVKSVVDVPHDGLNGSPLPTPPVTPLKRFNPVGRQVQAARVPPHLRVHFEPLWVFIAHIIDTAPLGPAHLLHAIIMIERLKEALPHLPAEDLSTLGISRTKSGLVALPCTHHRIALAIFMTTHKYLTDFAYRNRHWRVMARGIFDKEDILAMEVQFLLRMVGFDLFISEQDIIDRFYPLIYPAGDRRSRFHPDSLKRIQDYIRETVTVAPLTPVTPHGFSTREGGIEAAPAAATAAAVAEHVHTSFVLQPVPGDKKRAPKVVEDVSTTCIPVSQSSWNLTLPLADSTSSDCLLKVVSSYAMDEPSNVSSSNTGTSMTTTSTSVSATSSVHTPIDRPVVTFSTSSSQASNKATSRHRRSTLSVLDGSPHSSVMAKVLGVGRALSPSRVGHVIKGGNRKVSTATIVPDKVGLHN